MSLEHLLGRAYGPFDVGITPERVAEFVAATGDDPARWAAAAPPGCAATLLFAAAPAFFADGDVAPYARTLIHTAQEFRWSRELRASEQLSVDGRVAAVRVRGELNLVTFDVAASDTDGENVLESKSTFLMTRGAASEQVDAEPEPAPDEKGPNDLAVSVVLPRPGDPLPVLRKSASRSDLVRYAAATGDLNPIHWDHGAAVAAGLPGIVVHGLLMASWIGQAATRLVPGLAPLSELKIRFRLPLRPAVAAEIEGSVVAAEAHRATLRLAIEADGAMLVTADATVRRP